MTAATASVPNRPPRIAVIGGGLAGLAAAWHAEAAGFRVRVFEAGSRPGGPALGWRDGPRLFEYTPSLLELDAPLLAWIASLGLGPALHPALPVARRQLVLRQGRYMPLMDTPLAFMLSRRVDRESKHSVLRQSLGLLRRSPQALPDEVAPRVRQTLGDWFNDYMVAPWLATSQGADAESAWMALALADVADTSNRLTLARQLYALRQAPCHGFRHGLDTLTDTLSARVDVRLNQPVGALIRRAHGWCVVTGMETFEADLVILAVSAREAALLLAPSFPQIAASLAAVRYSPMIHVHSVYARDDVSHRLRAGGAWHPQVEHPFALGVAFVSSQLAHRAADDEVLLCARLGGMTQPERMGLDDAVLGLLLDSELDGLLGIQAAPLARHIHRQRHAFPHPDAALAQARQHLPGLGHARVLVASDWSAGAGPVAVLRHAMRLPEQAWAMLNGPQVLIEEV